MGSIWSNNELHMVKHVLKLGANGFALIQRTKRKNPCPRRHKNHLSKQTTKGTSSSRNPFFCKKNQIRNGEDFLKGC